MDRVGHGGAMAWGYVTLWVAAPPLRALDTRHTKSLGAAKSLGWQILTSAEVN